MQLHQSVPIQLLHHINPGASLSQIFVVDSDITFLEQVVLVFSMSFVGISQDDYNQYIDDYYYNHAPAAWPQRGRVIVNLISPSGTASTLLPYRPSDIFPGTYDNWSLSSTHFWGEDRTGIWTIFIQSLSYTVGTISVQVPKVKLYGLSRVPGGNSSSANESSFCDTICAMHNSKINGELTTRIVFTCMHSLTPSLYYSPHRAILELHHECPNFPLADHEPRCERDMYIVTMSCSVQLSIANLSIVMFIDYSLVGYYKQTCM